MLDVEGNRYGFTQGVGAAPGGFSRGWLWRTNSVQLTLFSFMAHLEMVEFFE